MYYYILILNLDYKFNDFKNTNQFIFEKNELPKSLWNIFKGINSRGFNLSHDEPYSIFNQTSPFVAGQKQNHIWFVCHFQRRTFQFTSPTSQVISQSNGSGQASKSARFCFSIWSNVTPPLLLSVKYFCSITRTSIRTTRTSIRHTRTPRTPRIHYNQLF